MKKTIRLATLLLCLLLVFMTGCYGAPATDTTASDNTHTVPPITDTPATGTVSTAPAADALYDQARQFLDGAQDITLELTITTHITVNGDVFSEQAVQTLTCCSIGTDSFAADMDSKHYFNIHTDEVSQLERSRQAVSYREIYADGILYIQCDNGYNFSSALDTAEAASRFIPVVLLDASLYGSVSSEATYQGTRILFAQPTAAEDWAVPEDAELVDASGSALINDDNTIAQMNYTVTYTYGPAEVRLEVQSKPKKEASQVTVPGDGDGYCAITHADAVYLAARATSLLTQADSIHAGSLESVVSAAAGFMRNQSTIVNLHGRTNDTKAKIETIIYAMDYTTDESQEYELTETFLDGEYTSEEDNAPPVSQSNITWSDIRDYCTPMLLSHVIRMDYWDDATVTDMGSTYLVEFTLNEDFGQMVQGNICNMLWQDPDFLIDLSSQYETTQADGYLSVDKYTLVTVAGGYYYEGIHTIDGIDYPLIMQFDQSVAAPAKGAYQEITDALPPEEEPETKATPLFYHVTGDNGQEMWLFGTIHVGDERTAYLPQEIRDAFEASDALALECNTEAFDQLAEEDDALQDQISDAYYYSDGTTLESLVEPEDYALAVQYAKATGTYNMNLPYAKPYLWSSGIEAFYLQQGQGLHGDQGVEERLMDWAEELDKPIWEIESSMFQIQMLTGFSDDLQLLLLSDSISTDARDYWESVASLYELWCAGDEAALREELSSTVDTSTLTDEELAEYEEVKPLYDEYDKAISYDRNDGMLEVAKQYLESGETVFYAVGLAHLLDNFNGLVDTLRAEGYTVELVAYQ